MVLGIHVKAGQDDEHEKISHTHKIFDNHGLMIHISTQHIEVAGLGTAVTENFFERFVVNILLILVGRREGARTGEMYVLHLYTTILPKHSEQFSNGTKPATNINTEEHNTKEKIYGKERKK